MYTVVRDVANAGTTDDPLSGVETSGEKVTPLDCVQP